MVRKYMVSVVAMIAIIAMVVAGCTTPTPEPPPPPPEERAATGAWVDEVVISQVVTPAEAISRLELGYEHIFGYSMSDAALFEDVQDSDELWYAQAAGSWNEYMFNGHPFFADGRFNPFGVAKIREAVNWLIDRDFIVDEIFGGLGFPKPTMLGTQFGETLKYQHIISEIEAYYAHNPDKAADVIEAAMLDAGAYIDETKGTWHYDGEEIELFFVIRSEDNRKPMGEYLMIQFQDLGFKSTAKYVDFVTASPLIWSGDALNGDWHVYTGGWIFTGFPLEQAAAFIYILPDIGYGPFLSYVDNAPGTEYNTKAWDFYYRNFSTMAEREEMAEWLLWAQQESAYIVYVLDQASFTPARNEVRLVPDAAGGILGCQSWPYTVHFTDAAGRPVVGGSLRVSMPNVIGQPWNPIDGSNWVYDMFPIRGTSDSGTMMDPRNGLVVPHRIESATITVITGLPVGKSVGPWLTLNFADEITVPATAWSDWNASEMRFITAAERFPDPADRVARSRRTVVYPADIFEVPLHDGSTLSMGDFIMGMILNFDRGKAESAIFDENYQADFESFMVRFKGLEITSMDPLTIVTYHDGIALDAEMLVTTWFPYYAQGPGMWHTLALAINAEADNKLAFNSAKADTLKAEWTNFIAGPSLDILRGYLTQAQAAAYPANIPYAPTLGTYITEEEATERYANLAEWSKPRAQGGKDHFWVASGPLYLDRAAPLEKILVLKWFEDYREPSDRYMYLFG